VNVWGFRALGVAKALAALLLLIYLPALAIIALVVIYTSPGPAFVNRVYRRVNGGTVELWEFRTECWAEWRLTGVGRYLKRSSLYRLPSLVNIIRGDIRLGEKVNPAVDWHA
jgi:putative colanic acid biosynthesis UDP-glucose lipid carrier transferase